MMAGVLDHLDEMFLWENSIQVIALVYDAFWLQSYSSTDRTW